MHRYRHVFVILALTLLFLWFTARRGPNGPERPAGPPKLVVQITVDQLRADLPYRHLERFGPGGFRYLMEHGLVYRKASHGHANTETIVGHTTLATGADPAVHGMVGNIWFDRGTGQLTYNVEDPEHPLLVPGAGVDAKTEIDPTQRVARSDGRSPRRILVSTFGDELSLFTNGRAKVFGVSVKDRGAIAMAGHAGKAYWFSKQSGAFVSSRFYGDALPDWVLAWNEKDHPKRYAGKDWALSQRRENYLFGKHDDRPFEVDLGGFGRTFPHRYSAADAKYFTTQLTVSPAGDELTREFAQALIENEQLGQDDVPDFLSVSFSSTDYVGHLFGPSSLEAEENLIRLDLTLERFFRFLDERVGLENTLIVLSADHGGADAPGHLARFGIDAPYIDVARLEGSKPIQALRARLGVQGKLVQSFFAPYVYLNPDAVVTGDVRDRAQIERLVAEALQQVDGIARAVSSTALTRGEVASTPVVDRILRNHNPRRSGDIYVVFDAGRYVNDFDGLTVAATHGSPWAYDTHVPIMVAGARVQAGRVTRSVETIDIALTLSLLFGAKPPSGATGEPLHEVLEQSGR